MFENATSTTAVDADVDMLFTAIRHGKWARNVLDIRDLPKDEYDAKKRKLPAVTWSGSFKVRKASEIIQYSNIVCLDIDHLTDKQVSELRKKLMEDEHVFFAFMSPSGKGFKILIRVSSGPENHLAAFLHLQKHFESKYLMKIDESGKDVSRLCFVSYDPDAIRNDDSKIFEVDLAYGKVSTVYNPPAGLQNNQVSKDLQFILETCKGWLSTGGFTYTQGQRNRYVHALACAVNRCGMSSADAEQLFVNEFADLDLKEIQHCIKSAFFHNSHEHGTVEIKDLKTGIVKFKAPPYVHNFTDNVVLNDLMATTAMLHHYKLTKAEIADIIGKRALYFKSEGLIDLDRKSLVDLMNESIKILNKKIVEETDNSTLEYSKAQDIGRELVKMDVNERCIPTNFPSIDGSMRGGMMPGYYGLIGPGGTYKSIFAQYVSIAAAFKDKAVLYLNGEMSGLQFYERLCSMTLKINLYQMLASKEINEGNIDTVIKEINNILKDNLFLVSGQGFGKEAILSTVANIEAKHNKKIGLIVIDGLSQMDPVGKDEIPASIYNSALCKEIAKEVHDGEGVVVLALIHVSGDQSAAKTRRDSGTNARGGGKIISNSDGYFSTSLLVDPATNDLDSDGDVMFLEDKFYLRYTDKRAGTGVVSTVINVGAHIELTEDNNDPRSYEVKIAGK